MQGVKVSWLNQTFALSKSNDSQGKKSRIRKSKEERKTMTQTFIKRYQSSNNGKFPSLSLTHKEVGGSFYIVREIVREIIQENRVLGPATSSSQNGDVTSLSVQNVLSLPPTIDQMEEATRFICDHEAVGDLSVDGYHEDAQAESKEVSTDDSIVISEVSNLTILENGASHFNNFEDEISVVSEVSTARNVHETIETIHVKSLYEDSLTGDSKDISSDSLISVNTLAANNANHECSVERIDTAESNLSVQVGFTSSMVVEETEAVKSNAVNISNCIHFTSNEITLSDCGVLESPNQTTEIADVEELPTVAANDTQIEDTAGNEVNLATEIIEKPILESGESKQRTKNVEESSDHSDGTCRLNFVLAIAPCLIMILWAIQRFEKAIFKSQRDESLLGGN